MGYGNDVLNFLKWFVVVVGWEEFGSKFRISRIKMPESSKDDFIGIKGIKTFKIFSGSNIPLIIKEDLIGSQSEESFVFFSLLSITHLSVAMSLELKGIAGDIIFSLEGFVIITHPMIIFIAFFDIDSVGIVHCHCFSNLNYYGF